MTSPKPYEVDLGPIRVLGCAFTKTKNTNGHYILSLRVGPHDIDIIASAQGNNVSIVLDETELAEK